MEPGAIDDRFRSTLLAHLLACALELRLGWVAGGTRAPAPRACQGCGRPAAWLTWHRGDGLELCDDCDEIRHARFSSGV